MAPDLDFPQFEDKHVFRAKLHDVKRIRNQISHNRLVDAHQSYILLSNLDFIISCFKDGRQNSISASKKRLLAQVEKVRLFMLDRLVEEEQCKMVRKCIDAQLVETFELRGCPDIYKEILKVPDRPGFMLGYHKGRFELNKAESFETNFN